MTLEQREKKARISRLQELRQQREQNTTGFNIDDDYENSEKLNTLQTYESSDDDDDFIDYEEEEKMFDRKPNTFNFMNSSSRGSNNGNNANNASFNKNGIFSNNFHANNADIETIKNDKYFKSLITALDSNSSSSNTSDSEQEIKKGEIENKMGKDNDHLESESTIFLEFNKNHSVTNGNSLSISNFINNKEGTKDQDCNGNEDQDERNKFNPNNNYNRYTMMETPTSDLVHAMERETIQDEFLENDNFPFGEDQIQMDLIEQFIREEQNLNNPPLLSREESFISKENDIIPMSSFNNDNDQQDNFNTNYDLGNSNLPPSSNSTKGGLSTAMSMEGTDRFNFYWFDMFEKPNSGTVILFGKIYDRNSWITCSVSVHNIRRNIFFLPRKYQILPNEKLPSDDHVTFKDLEEEVKDLLKKTGIFKYEMKRTSKRYAFEIPDIPSDADYLKVKYDFNLPSLKSSIQGGRCFSHIFGTTSGALELFLIKRNIMGPCWLSIKPTNMLKKNVSWCKMEMEVMNPKEIIISMEQFDPPPLNILSLSIRTIIGEREGVDGNVGGGGGANNVNNEKMESKGERREKNSSSFSKSNHTHRVASISGLFFNNVSIEGDGRSLKCNSLFSVVRDPENLGFSSKFLQNISSFYGSGSGSKSGRLEIVKNEKSLLNFLIAIINRHDPDVIVGHNALGFDLGVLLHRMKALKVDYWSKIGRLNWSQWPKSGSGTGGGSNGGRAGIGKDSYNIDTELSFSERQVLTGRLICDTFISAKDLIKAKSYSLQNLVFVVLNQRREELDYERVLDHFKSPQDIVKLLKHSELDGYYISMIMFQLMVLPLSKQLTNIAGNLWSRTLIGGRAERNEFLLLHEFHKLKFICPDKYSLIGKESKSNVNNNPQQQQSSLSLKAMTKLDDNPSLHHHHPIDEYEEGGEGDGMDEGIYNSIASKEPFHSGMGTGIPVASTSGRRKPAYAGGLVLDPKKGFYDKIVLLLDFNSLYPSIIQEFNICFTTIDRSDNDNDGIGGTLPSLPDSSVEMGLLPKLLSQLVAKRRIVKNLMKDPKISKFQYNQYHIRQQALKLTANSMYGCLGFTHSRFYAKALAMLITAKGREILQDTVNLVRNQCNLQVIYGDTDSIMVYTATRDFSEAKKMALLIKKTVNERYRLLELELDGIFEKLLLLKKKKYAALVCEEGVILEGRSDKNASIPNSNSASISYKRHLEMKGLDLVRRDWCELSNEMSNFVLEMIMSSEVREVAIQKITSYLQDTVSKIKEGAISMEKFAIHKNITKDPEQYADAKTQPHVMVALKMKEKGLSIRHGDTIPYIICCPQSMENSLTNGNGSIGNHHNHGLIADRAHHPDDLRKDPTLLIDIDWYMTQQIHPPISRLCEYIEELSSAKLASYLGLDSRKYHQIRKMDLDDEDGINSTIPSYLRMLKSDEELYKNNKRLSIQCPECKSFSLMESIISSPSSSPSPSNKNEMEKDKETDLAFKCIKCTKSFSSMTIYYQVLGFIRRYLSEYYTFTLKCNECHSITQRVRIYESQCITDSCRGRMRPIISGSQVYNQLLYLKYLFDLDKQASKIGIQSNDIPKEWRIFIQPTRDMISRQLEKCAYPIIDLKEIFFRSNPSSIPSSNIVNMK